MAHAAVTSPPALHRRLLADIVEVQQDPYPNVHLSLNHEDITHACLVRYIWRSSFRLITHFAPRT
jgi:hypothetical protein